MPEKLQAVLVTLTFSVIGIVGDYFLKLASSQESPLKTRAFYLGFILYASTAFGWVYVMRHLKLGTISILYSVSMIVFLTAIGVFVFGEKLSRQEMVGILMAIGSLFLLVRFG